MNKQAARKYLLSKPASREDFPFGEEAAVFKVRDKMFALLSMAKSPNGQAVARMNLKCDPQQAYILRDIFPAVIPGYHMNKKHWNSVMLDGSIPRGEIERMIDHSYALVVKGLLKKDRLSLEIQYGPETLYRGLMADGP